MLSMLENGIRGRIYHAVHQYAEANSKYIKDYDKNKEASYLKYWDVNNSYGWAMLDPAKFTYSLLFKAFEKQIKPIEDQAEKQIKAIFEEFANERMDEIQRLSKIIILIIQFIILRTEVIKNNLSVLKSH